MKIGNFLGCLVIAIFFGIVGIHIGEGFINYGSVLMGLASLPFLFLISNNYLLRGEKK